MQSWRSLDQRAHPLRSAQLMGGNRYKIGARGADIERNASGHLDSIDMQHAAGSVDEGGSGPDRLDDAGLVVSRHDRDERRTRTLPLQLNEAVLQGPDVDHTVLGDGNLLHLVRREASARTYRGMLDRRNHQPVEAAVVLRRLQRPAQGHHIGLGPARREHDIARLRPDQCRDALARLLDEPPCGTALVMHRRRIADEIERRNHRGAGFRPQRSGGIPVQIDALAHPQIHSNFRLKTYLKAGTRELHVNELHVNANSSDASAHEVLAFYPSDRAKKVSEMPARTFRRRLRLPGRFDKVERF